MFGGLNPKKMQAVMKQMGISSQEISASRVIIEKADSRIIIENPTITKIKMQGQESYQISGESYEESKEMQITEEDILTIIEKTGCTRQQAEKKLKENSGDLAQTILDLN